MTKEKTALLFVTGRGLGGDAVIAYNLIKLLTNNGIQCEIALDESAPGLLFKKKGLDWHKVSIPQAGGHAASKSAAAKAGVKTLKAVKRAKKLIQNLNVDLVLGVIGGGAVIGCMAAKRAKVPSVGVLSTPLDTKVCRKLTNNIIFPENPLFGEDELPDNLHKSFFPMDTKIMEGNKDKALKLIKQHCDDLKKVDDSIIEFDENKKTILFSSGSTLFEKTAQAIDEFSKYSEDYNLILIGSPLKEEFNKYVDQTKVINLGYIDWIADLYDLVDLAILTDDGIMLQEALICNIPIVILKRVKYGRYHNMATIFDGACLEADLDDLSDKIELISSEYDSFKSKTYNYSEEILQSNEIILNLINESFK